MFVAFCNDQTSFEKILGNLLDPDPTNPMDRLMSVVEAISGSYWYVLAAAEFGVPSVSGHDDLVEDQQWRVRSPNGYLFYNSQDYLHQMAEGRYIGGDPPSDRLLSLMSRTFSHWRDGWMDKPNFPRLPSLDTLYENNQEKQQAVRQEPVPIRKGLAKLHSLALHLSAPDSKIARYNGLLRIEAKKLIVGVIPDLTLGRGKEVVPYLNKDERIAAWLKGQLNEWSAMGHVVPDYQKLVQNGLLNHSR